MKGKRSSTEEKILILWEVDCVQSVYELPQPNINSGPRLTLHLARKGGSATFDYAA
jgi:hypothetical protein